MDLVEKVRAEGLRFLEKALKDKELFKDLYYQLDTKEENVALNKAIEEILIQEGHKQIEMKKAGKQFVSPLLAWIRDKETAKRLHDLMLTPQGMKIISHVANTASGEFLIFRPMTTDYSAAHGFVNTLFVAPGGRSIGVTIMDAACGNEIDKTIVPKFPKAKEIKDKQKKLEEWIKGDIEKDICFFEHHHNEALELFKEILKDEKNVDVLAKFLVTEKGRKLAARVGKIGFGRKCGACYLWNTYGGRQLVKKLLASFEGHEAIYAIMTGMTRAEFIASTAPLE